MKQMRETSFALLSHWAAEYIQLLKSKHEPSRNPLIFIFMATLSMILLYNPCLWFKVFLHCVFVVGKSGLLYVALIKRITVCLYVYICIYSDI